MSTQNAKNKSTKKVNNQNKNFEKLTLIRHPIRMIAPRTIYNKITAI